MSTMADKRTSDGGKRADNARKARRQCSAKQPQTTREAHYCYATGKMSTNPPPERLMALDVFRGITIAGMLLVNNPGTWSAIYPPLEHAPWHGWTPTDLIFPFFVFVVGVPLRGRAAFGHSRHRFNPAAAPGNMKSPPSERGPKCALPNIRR